MFEDSLFESGGAIRNSTKSRYWMLLTFITNGSLLLLLVLIPLLYPQTLPKAAMMMTLVAPPPPPPPPPPPAAQVMRAAPVRSEMLNNQLTAPTRIPKEIKMVSEREAPPSASGFGVIGGEMGGSANGVLGGVFSEAPKSVQLATPKKVTISQGVASGLLLQKTMPVYPAIAKAARVQGSVVLHATISKAGSIENLQVLSGPTMLQQAALDAVKQWKYRPYLLNNEPVEVETTVNVIFTLGG